MSAGAWALGPDSYEAPRVKGGDLAAWRTRQCGIEDTAAPSPSWRGWSSPEAACGAPKAQGLRNVANSVIIKSEVFCVQRLSISSLFSAKALR